MKYLKGQLSVKRNYIVSFEIFKGKLSVKEKLYNIL